MLGKWRKLLVLEKCHRKLAVYCICTLSSIYTEKCRFIARSKINKKNGVGGWVVFYNVATGIVCNWLKYTKTLCGDVEKELLPFAAIVGWIYQRQPVQVLMW